MPETDFKRAFALEVAERLKRAGFQALWAGGCVRDVLLGITPKDYDVATDARPEQVRDLFGRRRTLAVGASFGVILVRGPKLAGDIEVATFRTEGPYADGRRPEHVSFTSPEEDAQRRDFTINGMFYDPTEHKVLDYVGGERDLSAGVVRAIGEPRERMREDKLRMLRAVRFAATLDFQLDPATADAVREMAREIHVVSAERITQELKRMLVDRHRRRAIELAHEVGLLGEILPELEPMLPHGKSGGSVEWERTLHMLKHLQKPSFELAMATLLHAASGADNSDTAANSDSETPLSSREGSGEGQNAQGSHPSPNLPPQGEGGHEIGSEAGQPADVVRGVCRRLRLSNDETDRIVWLVEHQHSLDQAPQLRLCQLKRLMAHPFFDDLLALSRVEALVTDGDLGPVLFCEDYLRKTPRDVIDPPPLITGDDLKARGLVPGPNFRKLLDAIRDAQLDERIHTKEDAIELLDRLLEEG